MKRWIVGSNTPACLPDTDPTEHLDWQEAADHLLYLIGDHYDAVSPWEGLGRSSKAALNYLEARATVCAAKKEQPLSLFYAGKVYWLADLP